MSKNRNSILTKKGNCDIIKTSAGGANIVKYRSECKRKEDVLNDSSLLQNS